jgi:chromosome segregation ATPase
MRAIVKAAAVLTLVLAGPAGVQAQVARSGSAGGPSAETARLAQQLQQASAERLQLQAEVKRLQAELDAAKKAPAEPPAEVAALRQRAQAAEQSAQRSRAAADEAEAKAARLQAKLDELVPRFRDTTKALRETDADRTTLQSAAQRQHESLTTCVENNERLLKLNTEVVERLEHTGFWTKLAADEPFTRLKRTELENLADANRAAAGALAVAPPGPLPEARPLAQPPADAGATP